MTQIQTIRGPSRKEMSPRPHGGAPHDQERKEKGFAPIYCQIWVFKHCNMIFNDILISF
jgi:hypothetical protein